MKALVWITLIIEKQSGRFSLKKKRDIIQGLVNHVKLFNIIPKTVENNCQILSKCCRD